MPTNDACGQRADLSLNVDLTILSADVFDELMRLLRKGVHLDPTADARDLWEWAVTLGTLTYDIATSVHILETHNAVRAGMILNRSLSEYRVRLSFYIRNPTAAHEDLASFNSEFLNTLFSRPTAEIEAMLPPEMLAEIAQLRSEPAVKFKPRQIRQMFDSVYEDKARLLYGVHYAIASAFAHGKVLATGDVLRRDDPNDAGSFTYHPHTNVFSLNNTLGETVGHAIEMLVLCERVFALKTSASTLKARFVDLLPIIAPEQFRQKG